MNIYTDIYQKFTPPKKMKRSVFLVLNKLVPCQRKSKELVEPIVNEKITNEITQML
jgi:predicted CopG family antitoxin